jgi:hypothetical protein
VSQKFRTAGSKNDRILHILNSTYEPFDRYRCLGILRGFLNTDRESGLHQGATRGPMRGLSLGPKTLITEPKSMLSDKSRPPTDMPVDVEGPHLTDGPHSNSAATLNQRRRFQNANPDSRPSERRPAGHIKLSLFDHAENECCCRCRCRCHCQCQCPDQLKASRLWLHSAANQNDTS